ncbi:MAG: hypothetical protein FGF51_06100 [Candidatus Brockarchaeota archaeon]|nr:hypothetical protein [Candidatus Brockarchaeota archaeon]
MLEEIMREEMAEDFLEQALRDLKDYEGREIDFEPVEPEGGPVSELIMVMRNERNSNISWFNQNCERYLKEPGSLSLETCFLKHAREK